MTRWLTYPQLAEKLGLEWPRQRQTLYNMASNGVFRGAQSRVPGMGTRFDDAKVDEIMRAHVLAEFDLSFSRGV